jgi:ribosomal protein S18 acetylase RimI-like enzyme
MIREMKHGEEDKARTILAKLDYEDQVFHQLKSNSCLRLDSPGNEPAMELYRNAGFKEVDQLVMAFIRRKENGNQHV